MIIASANFMNAMKSQNTQVFLKLELYDQNYNFLKEISQQITTNIGSITITNDSPIRRSFSLNLDNTLGDFFFGENNLIWLDKRFKLYVGLKMWSGDIEYVPLGVYVLTQPQNQHTTQVNDTTINAVDKAYFMTDKRGLFVNNVTISTGAKITDAIRTLASQFGETLFNFDDVEDLVPYDLTYSGTDNVWKALQELAQIAKCVIYYNVYGYLTLRKIDLNYFDNQPITWSYNFDDQDNERFYAGSVRQLDDSNLYNDIVVLGGSSDTATCSYRLTVDETNPIWAGNPYSIQKIQNVTYYWNNGSPDSLLLTNDDCKFRAKYELMNRLGMTEKIQMSLALNFLHDVNDCVFVQDSKNGITGNKYIINQINLPLALQAMTMDVQKYEPVITDWSSF